MTDRSQRRARVASKLAVAGSVAALCAACALQPMPPAAAVTDLAPSGSLRAAINFGNPVLASKDPGSGEARGVSVDLARELAKRLGVPLRIVTYPSAGQVVEGLKSRAWDVAFLAIDPARAVDIGYTAPYVVIAGAYLVRRDSPIRSNAEVDRDGVRVAVGKGSAYDLFLSRELKRAQIERAPTSPEVTDFFLARNLDVAAGVRQQMEADARRVGGVRVLDGSFMVINQAMGMPKGGDAGLDYLRSFVEQMKASGFVAAALARHGIEGAAVAPPARP
jgi:polar amino acid transport system substrate-binding protein